MDCQRTFRNARHGGHCRRDNGFTLVELTAVVAIILVLVSLLTSALNHTKEKALRLSCLNNLKQLQQAWRLYTDDNNGSFPLNQTAATPANDHRFPFMRSSDQSWVRGNPLVDLDTVNLRRGSLFEYVNNTEVYKCGLDSSTVFKRPDLPRTRSYAMSAYLGGDAADSRVRFKESDLRNPGPENTFVFIEEHESSLWAANFMVLPRDKVSAGSAGWVSTPADRHYQGCNISFADGHVEYWRWFSPKEARPHHKLASSGRELRDVRRLQAAVPQEN